MKTDFEIHGLTLNNRFFTLPALIRFCKNEINAKTATDWELEVFRFILAFLSDSKTVFQQTSGTTGAKKTIELPKSALLTSAKNTIKFFKLEKDDVAVLCLPVQYIAGKMMVVRSLLAGLNLKLIEPSGTPNFSGIKKVDFCAMVPMQATHLIEQNLWPEIKTLILGGAEAGAELLEHIQQLETQVFETYGMAETCSHVALKKLNGEDAEILFTTLHGVQLSLDERECLVIKTNYLSETIVTNDRVELVSNGQFKWLGRFDNVINSGGIKIQPEILEKQFEDILQKSCAVIGKPDKLLGKKMVLILETDKSADKEQIITKLKPHFDKKMLPKEIYFLEKFPRNKSFKVERNKLQKMIL